MKKRLLTVVAAIAALVLSSPIEAGRPMQPQDLYSIKRVSDPQVSPDGRLIAFTVTRADLGRNEADSDLWLLAAAGGEPKRLTSGPGADHSPRWSPDGKKLAFISDRSGVDNLHIISIDGGEARQLTSSETDVSNPQWSRDGRTLIVGSRVVPEDKEAIENWTREELPKSEARTIDRLLFRQWNRWLGDERNHLFRVDATSGAMTDLTPGDFDTPPVSLTSSHDSDLSPDGSELVFVRNDDPDSAASTNHDLYLTDLANGKTTKITDNPGRDANPNFSPDGRFIAYTSMATPGYEADEDVLVIYDRTTGEHRRLTDDLDRSVGELAWSPGGDSIVFTAREEGRISVFVVDLEGEVTRIAHEGYSGGLSMTPDGKRVVVARSYNDRPAELYSIPVAGGTSDQLTSINADLTRELDLPPLEDIRFEGADGVMVHGFIQRPPGFEEGKKYPLVLTIHGGPQGMWADRFMTSWFTFQLVSSPGYVGLFLNPRGSEGYGSEFKAQVSRDYGGRCIRDLMLGLDYVLENFDFVDRERLAVIGGSFGGYSVNWIIGHDDRFRCAVSHAGLYNLTSFFGATEELWFPAWDMGSTPWDEPELYARWSPHTAAGSMSTPTLITHGERDYRVPFAESLQLFTALQHQKVPSRLVVFPDEGHVIKGPQNNVRWWKEIHRWLEAYLGD
ncbi:MAG: prolyl oligopeptidase family serine peptidase [Thermoanaerobaculales bacterium]